MANGLAILDVVARFATAEAEFFIMAALLFGSSEFAVGAQVSWVG